MPTYEYYCDICGEYADFTCSIANYRQGNYTHPHCSCLAPMRRRFSLAGHKVTFHDHYNHSLGEYVSSQRDLTSAFSRHSDLMSERLGMTVDYQPIDPLDAKPIPKEPKRRVTGDGKVTRETTRNPLNKQKVTHGGSKSE